MGEERIFALYRFPAVGSSRLVGQSSSIAFLRAALLSVASVPEVPESREHGTNPPGGKRVGQMDKLPSP